MANLEIDRADEEVDVAAIPSSPSLTSDNNAGWLRRGATALSVLATLGGSVAPAQAEASEVSDVVTHQKLDELKAVIKACCAKKTVKKHAGKSWSIILKESIVKAIEDNSLTQEQIYDVIVTALRDVLADGVKLDADQFGELSKALRDLGFQTGQIISLLNQLNVSQDRTNALLEEQGGLLAGIDAKLGDDEEVEIGGHVYADYRLLGNNPYTGDVTSLGGVSAGVNLDYKRFAAEASVGVAADQHGAIVPNAELLAGLKLNEAGTVKFLAGAEYMSNNGDHMAYGEALMDFDIPVGDVVVSVRGGVLFLFAADDLAKERANSTGGKLGLGVGF